MTVRSKTKVPFVVVERKMVSTYLWIAAPPLFGVENETVKFLLRGDEIDTMLGDAGTVVAGAAANVNTTGALEALKKPILAALFAVT